jgi:hypothetical protein
MRWKKGRGQSVNPMMLATPTLFKTLTNFALEEFDELAS